MTPVLDALRPEVEMTLGIELLTEGSGSQVACRKVSDLRRECDVLILADTGMVRELLAGDCTWRIDFATDELVLAVGTMAPHVALAETNWVAALLSPDCRLGRADERLSPIGYRTLLAWQLESQRRGDIGLTDRLTRRAAAPVEDVGQLVPLLKSGQIDYAFVYRSTCIANDMRFVPLSAAINLGSPDVDYSSAHVTLTPMTAGPAAPVLISGAPAVWTLTIPERSAHKERALLFIRHFLSMGADAMKKNGFTLLPRARFYGRAADVAGLGESVEYGGAL
jgi:molybdate/tungstate transport system substrate-binding protein